MLVPLLLCCQGVPHVHSPGDAFSGDLAGVHLHITTVHSIGAIDMGIDGGNILLPSAQWTGFMIDVVNWVAAQAGFTYTLSLPSGLGPSCSRDADGNIQSVDTYAGQYKCLCAGAPT